MEIGVSAGVGMASMFSLFLLPLGLLIYGLGGLIEGKNNKKIAFWLVFLAEVAVLLGIIEALVIAIKIN